MEEGVREAPPLLAAEDAAAPPEDQARCLRKYSFWWAFPTILRARDQGHLGPEDLPDLPRRDEPPAVFARCAAIWTGSPRSLLVTLLWASQRRLFLTCVLHRWSGLLCQTLQPLMLHTLLSSAGAYADLGVGLGLVGAMTASMLWMVATAQYAWHTSVRTLNNARSAVIHAIFRCTLLGSGEAEREAGTLTNLMATDADKFGKSDGLVNFLAEWSWAIMSLPVVIFFLSRLVGLPPVILAMAVIVGGSFVNKWLMSRLRPRVQRVQGMRDQRARLMNELVRGIRTVKLQVWEDTWRGRIAAVREQELKLLIGVQYLGALNSLVGSLLSLAVPTTIFAWRVLVDGEVLDGAVAFTTLAWLSMLQLALQTLPAAYTNYANLAPSERRLRELLLPGDTAPVGAAAAWLRPVLADAAYEPAAPPGAPALHLCASSLGYAAPGGASVVLRDLNLEVRRGEFAVVVGAVGAGKSTLLAALAGAQAPLCGSCDVRGARAYATQKPFLLNATLRENVLFTRPYDAARYEDALRRVALGPDLEALALGDATQVGEHGVQLSGGQKARVALARALYAGADTVVCDDVLSAVDAHTARHLWNEALLGGLVASGCTVVLATHQLQYLQHPQVSRVLVLVGGAIVADGPWATLPEDLRASLGSNAAGPRPAEPPSEESPANGVKEAGRAGSINLQGEDVAKAPVALELGEVEGAVARLLRAQEGRRVTPELIGDVLAGLRGRSQEVARQGGITWPDFSVYLSAFGSWLTLALLAAATLGVACLSVLANTWLSIWTSSHEASQQRRNLGIYISIGVANGLCNTVQSFVQTHCALRASRRIHGLMLQRLLAAPLSFFETVATGRLLNRFLQDLDSIDSYVPGSLMDQVNRTLSIITQLSLIYLEAPWVLLSLPVLVPPYVLIYRHVRVSNRDAKRLEALGHAPVYAHFGESLAGRETIRAYGLEGAFVRRNLELVRGMALGKYANQAVGKWAQALSTQWSCLLFLVSGVCCVYLSAQGEMSSSQVGLVLLYASALNGALTAYTVSTAVLESQFVSVERVAEYTRLPVEEAGAAALPPVSWPSRGALSLRAVRLRYAPHLLPALRGVDLEVPPGEKVALCGRTGCGKTSLFGVLTRLYPLTAGSAELDGLNIEAVPLRALRRALRVVSQDAFLVSGSVAENLLLGSGAGLAAGAEAAACCRRVLCMVGMEDRVASAGGLEALVQDGGGNFSVGERQLLTLARALVPAGGAVAAEATWQPPRVLLCDEATASVDLAADRRIHDVLLGLEGATVVMICHRLQYIPRFGLVAVLSAGQVAEQGAPAALLAAPDSQLRALCMEAGLLGEVLGP